MNTEEETKQRSLILTLVTYGIIVAIMTLIVIF